MKKRIEIHGHAYTVRSDDDSISIEAVAAEVDERMSALARKAPHLDDHTVAVLVALNLASDLAKVEARVRQELAAVTTDLDTAEALLEQALPFPQRGQEGKR